MGVFGEPRFTARRVSFSTLPVLKLKYDVVRIIVLEIVHEISGNLGRGRLGCLCFWNTCKVTVASGANRNLPFFGIGTAKYGIVIQV